MGTELETFHELVEAIEVAMMTTRRPDGRLESRAMATQKRADDADLWFVSADDTNKVRDLREDPRLNLSYYDNGSREWVSVSGTATLTKDEDKIRELYAADWKLWFHDEGDPRHGTPNDPRLILIGVKIDAASYLEVDKSRPVAFFEVAKSASAEEETPTDRRLGMSAGAPDARCARHGRLLGVRVRRYPRGR